ncbi:SusC/RagA family TonB-linked outer membrane protein [Anditalea andensis]|nr:TonB-dependent receptor [Anditalea andensis]
MDKILLWKHIFFSRKTKYFLAVQFMFTLNSFAGNAYLNELNYIEKEISEHGDLRLFTKINSFSNVGIPEDSLLNNTQQEVKERLLHRAHPIKFTARPDINAVATPRSIGFESSSIPAQTNVLFAEITGVVTDTQDNLPIPGVTVTVKGTSRGTVTDMDGRYSIDASPGEVLVFRFIGFAPIEVTVTQQTVLNITLTEDFQALQEVIVVGYAEQKKETIVGAVTQTSGAVLQRTGGVSNVAAALTGNLPGLITTASTGMPGAEQPQILIRGQNSWNGSGPLILVDGVERPEFFNNMDIGSVESISVLKDASATAVFGSRGANGVIIITTKRGMDGRAEITASFNTTVKTVSQLPGKYDSYDALSVRNRAIEYELSRSPASWNQFLPQGVLQMYRNQTSIEQAERYPNVDWQDVLFNDYAMAYNANVSLRGGTRVTKYFASIDFQNEGDMMRDFENNRGYNPGYDFNRLNVRSNLDFQLTPSTVLKVNLGGIYGVRKSPWGGGNSTGLWSAAYSNPPDAFVPRYADGFWGYYGLDEQAALNSVRILSVSGVEYNTTVNLMTNFTLEQDLGMLLEGLSVRGNVSIDNAFVENERGVNDQFNDSQLKWINPNTGQEVYKQAFDPNSRFDFNEGVAWNPSAGNIAIGGAQRRIFYQGQINYAGSVDDRHNYTVMGLVNRQEDAIGSMIPMYREDWVFRGTYNFNRKYMFEYNGAYNGSEKFAPDYRFAFFSSGGLGWVVSEENFMRNLRFVDFLKVRASYGEVGDDNIGGRFLFMNQWAYGDNSQLGTIGWQGEYSPYTWFREDMVGNPSVRWETVYKYNLGAEYSFLNGLVEGSIDVFRDNRVDILMRGDRAIPDYFGTAAPAANLGRVQTEGFEITLGVNHTFANGLRLFADFAITHAKDQILDRDDPQLLPDYQQQRGFQLGQARTHISSGFYNTWDELYASTPHNTNNQNKIPGNYHILDMNGDGIIDAYDVAPYGFSGTPQNTYNTNLGFEWKGFSGFLQFYGVNNVTRQVVFSSLTGQRNLVYEEGTYWSKDNPNPDTPMPRWLALASGFNSGSRYFFDGSYLRLKNAEIAYRFQTNWVRTLGLESLRVYLNGNNLLLWTDMPDDRESNFAGTGWAAQGAYPTVRRFNLGLNVTF